MILYYFIHLLALTVKQQVGIGRICTFGNVYSHYDIKQHQSPALISERTSWLNIFISFGYVIGVMSPDRLTATSLEAFHLQLF